MHINNLKSKLNEAEFYNKRVFLRVDLNVPLLNDKIVNDARLNAILPTLNLLIKKGARIVLATHIGRPEGYDKSLSTELLLNWFCERNYNITFVNNLECAQEYINKAERGQIILLENLRFYKQEQELDEQFATELKKLADYYVNDAFGLIHRNNTSITLLPKLFDKENKTIGLLIEKELEALSYLKHNAQKPFILILGGGKVKDKLPLLKALINKVDVILLCPATCFTFLKALNKPVGKSLVDDTEINLALEILNLAHEKSVKIVFPVDYLVALDSYAGPLCYVKADNFPDNAIGISIGQETIDLFKQEIFKAKTIFLNGAMGLRERPETYSGLRSLLQTIAQSIAYSVIGGGGSVAAVYQYGLESAINFCSTGGGAALAYLIYKEGDKVLPGLADI